MKKELTTEEIVKVVESSKCDYEVATRNFANKNIEKVSGEMVMRDAKYDCGMEGEEVAELTMKVKFKVGSLFQPHTGTLEQFLDASLKSVVEGEINCHVGLRIENPEG